MNISPFRPGLGLIGTGIILWLAGVVLPILLPVVAPVGAVLILIGQLLFWIGVAVLVVQLIVAVVRGTL